MIKSFALSTAPRHGELEEIAIDFIIPSTVFAVSELLTPFIEIIDLDTGFRRMKARNFSVHNSCSPPPYPPPAGDIFHYNTSVLSPDCCSFLHNAENRIALCIVKVYRISGTDK